MQPPAPTSEIRMLSLRSLRGANFWSSRPVTRIDLAVGAYDEISSADVPGVTEALMAALPGLIEHRCSVGERGGFLARLRRGTYAPHIVEHLALELQTMIGHEVGYGRARGGDRPGEYTVAFEHRHAEVGLRAAALALELVQRAFAGRPVTAAYAVAELQSLAASPDAPPLSQRVLCGVTGGGDRAALRDELARRGIGVAQGELVVDVAPAYLLNAGLPYRRSELAIILDARPLDVPERYREPGNARRLVSVLADGVRHHGLVIVPAGEQELRELVRDAGRRVAVFSTAADLAREDARRAHARACVRDGRIVVEAGGAAADEPLRADAPADAQVAAALARLVLEESALQPQGEHGRDR